MESNTPETVKQGLSKKFSDEILTPSIDLSVDYSEIFIDDLMDNAALKEIPIVKSIVGVIKAGISINQFWFAKKLLTFIKEFNMGNIDSEKKMKFQQKINSDDKYRKKVVEQIMVFIDRHIEINKTKICANLFQAFVEEKITYNEFVSLNISLDKLHPDSYFYFKELETVDFKIGFDNKEIRNSEAETLLSSSGLGIETSPWAHRFQLSEKGIKLYSLGIKPLINLENQNNEL